MKSSFYTLSSVILMTLWHPMAFAKAEMNAADASTRERDMILVTGARTEKFAGTKTETPLIETPQPLTVISADTFLAQGAINISDTVRYAAGVTAGPYGRDTRVDSFAIRGISALQFRDGMRDIFSSYASITSDPYNFSRVEVVRGPASVLFGQGSLGGLVNLVSKTPLSETRGEIAATYGSFDRKEIMADLNIAASSKLAFRAVGRLRESGTHIDYVSDDRIFFAPSILWQPSPDTDITLLGLYQKDESGSTSQFLPIVGTLLPNGNNPRLDPFLYVGKPDSDRYDGTLWQGGGSIVHRFSDSMQLSLKARYIDSDLTYVSHYTNSYSAPTNPYTPNTNGRRIALTGSGNIARLNVFSTDNNLQFKFNTGAQIEHLLMAGIDYSWNEVRKRTARTLDEIDIYDIDRNLISNPTNYGAWTIDSQKQLGFYVQDQIRFADRVSVVLGARRDRVENQLGKVDKATTLRAGIIGEIGANLSPFFSYTESFLPIAGSNSQGVAFRPQRGKQFETGVKWQPDLNTLVTVTAFHIKETGRPIADPANPLQRIQAGELTTKGIEFEANRTLPGDIELVASYGYNKLTTKGAPYFDYLPRHTASFWTTKTFEMRDDLSLRLGTGVRYTGKRTSIGSAWTIVTNDNTQVDALAEINWQNWRFAVNATNLLNKTYFASCLARGDCFVGAPRNVMATVGVRF